MLTKNTLFRHFIDYYLKINVSFNWFQNYRYFSQNNDFIEIKKCCDILRISYDFTANDLRDGYIESCKRTHPDINASIGGDVKDNDEFVSIEMAYNRLKDYLKSKESEKEKQNMIDLNDTEEDDEDNRLRHTVPQHRQYLNFDGIGFGTPTERQKQYERHRLMKATKNVSEFELNKIKTTPELSENKSIVLKDPNIQRKIKVKQGFERLVEDLIQESMAKGEFENLPGYGKPLKYKPEYPYLDSTTYKLNEILINNGFIPEWVSLEREIRDDRNAIENELMSLKRQSKLGNISYIKQVLEERVKALNRKIEKYNRIVPILTKQKILFVLHKEVNKYREMDENVCQKQ